MMDFSSCRYDLEYVRILRIFLSIKVVPIMVAEKNVSFYLRLALGLLDLIIG